MARQRSEDVSEERLPASARAVCCQCCLDGAGELRNMQEEHHTMVYKCFGIEIAESALQADVLICTACIDKLRETLVFKQQIEESQKALRCLHSSQDSCEGFLSPELSETRQNPLAYVFIDDLLIKAEACLNESEKGREDERDAEQPQKGSRYRRGAVGKANSPYKVERSERTCRVCQQAFPTHRRLVRHMTEHFPNHICNQCGKAFVREVQLISHLRTTHSSVRVACPTCSKLIKKEGLKRHMGIHTGDVLHQKCLYCPQRFYASLTRLNHMVRCHGYQQPEYKCSVCPKVFKLAAILSEHVKSVHCGEKNHTCEQCGKQFFSKHRLKMHSLRHTHQRDFECGVCHKKYARKSTLTEHMKIHNNVKEHVCPVCGRAFTQKCTLQAHLRTHDPYAQ